MCLLCSIHSVINKGGDLDESGLNKDAWGIRSTFSRVLDFLVQTMSSFFSRTYCSGLSGI